MMKYITILFIFFTTLLVGCSDKDEIDGNSSSPSFAASAFFDALYNHNNIDKATEFATPKLRRVMRSYGTAKQFTLNYINMKFDKVKIEVDMSNTSLREQYGETAKINMIFNGIKDGQKIVDMRSVQLVVKKGKWYVSKINSDPFAK